MHLARRTAAESPVVAHPLMYMKQKQKQKTEIQSRTNEQFTEVAVDVTCLYNFIKSDNGN